VTFRRRLRPWLPVFILLAGALLALALATTGPEAPKRSRPKQARLVDVLPLEVTDTRARVTALGTARPARRVDVTARVSGAVVELGPAMLPGGRAQAGELLARLDPRDYQYVLRQRASDLARAEQNYKVEAGQQGIAQREYELLGELVDQDQAELVLRQPQLETVRAALDAARAALEKAQLDLRRTEIRAPFNCIVLEKKIDVGAVVSGNVPVATIVGTDAFWIEVAVPLEKLRWIDIPQGTDAPGSAVRVRQTAVWGEDVWRDGEVLRLLGDLEPSGRMARLLVEVEDPYALAEENRGAPPLLVDSFVEAEIIGRNLDDVVVVPRRFVQNGSTVWICAADRTLDIRSLHPVFTSRENVYVIEGLRPGELLVTSELSTPVAGMLLRVRGEEDRTTADDRPGPPNQEEDGSDRSGRARPAAGDEEAQR
jgi:RND family efflux transporter MFP subunit